MSFDRLTRSIVPPWGGELPDFRSAEFERYDDKQTYDMLGRGESFGVFQLESSGMRELMMKLKPGTFEEVIVLIALFRPGTLDAGMHEIYCNRKNGLEKVVYDHAKLKPILEALIFVSEQPISLDKIHQSIGIETCYEPAHFAVHARCDIGR